MLVPQLRLHSLALIVVRSNAIPMAHSGPDCGSAQPGFGAIDETRTHTPSPAPASRTGGSTDSPTMACLVGDERLERSRPLGRRGLSPPGLPIPPVADKAPRQRFERRFAG